MEGLEIKDITEPTDPSYHRVLVAEYEAPEGRITINGYLLRRGRVAYHVSQHGNPKALNRAAIFEILGILNDRLTEGL